MKWKSDYPAFNEKEIPEIVDLNVLPQYQNKGIGTQLIQACEAMATEQSIATIGIGVGMNAMSNVCLSYVRYQKTLTRRPRKIHFGMSSTSSVTTSPYRSPAVSLKRSFLWGTFWGTWDSAK